MQHKIYRKFFVVSTIEEPSKRNGFLSVRVATGLEGIYRMKLIWTGSEPGMRMKEIKKEAGKLFMPSFTPGQYEKGQTCGMSHNTY